MDWIAGSVVSCGQSVRLSAAKTPELSKLIPVKPLNPLEDNQGPMPESLAGQSVQERTDI